MRPLRVSVPSWLSSSIESILASPKSSSFTPPSFGRKTFAGFRSRCTTSLSCASASAARMGSQMASACAGSRGPRPSACSRVSPSSSSMAMKVRPLSVPKPSTSTMFGCESFASTRASREKRRASPPMEPRFSCRTLSAAGRPLGSCVAR
ncbi:MAG: hypothetical protein M5U28_14260 [Sandaracinaceae bacterium]|nr:hypothetical protein [Sandaracinaceae bacterium]